MFGRRWACGVAVLMWSFATGAHAGIDLIVIEKPINSRHLEGVVIDHSGATVPGALVEECSILGTAPSPAIPEVERDFHAGCGEAGHVVAMTICDSTGHFVLPKTIAGGRHTLLISANGFNPTRVTVKLKLIAHGKMRIALVLAT